MDEAKFKFIELLETATPLAHKEALQRYPISQAVTGDTYLEFYCPSIRETMIAIRRKDGAIVTVLTHEVFSYHTGKAQKKINRQRDFLREKIMG